MAEDSPSSEAIRRGYEVEDVNEWALLWIGIGVAITIAFSALIAWAWIDISAPGGNQWIPVSAGGHSERLGTRRPPSQSLPGAPLVSPEAYSARKTAKLHGYGWMNKQAGIVHIPIGRAMALIAKHGLPDFNQRSSKRARVR